MHRPERLIITAEERVLADDGSLYRRRLNTRSGARLFTSSPFMRNARSRAAPPGRFI